MMKKNPLSIYFHWPWCKSKCPYCDFFKLVNKNVDQAQVIDSYCQELDFYKQLIPDRTIRSVFFGGGTPSLIEPQHISRLLDYIADLWPLEKTCEISLEANPNTTTEDLFSQFKSAGINRLSLGIQALNEQDLRFLGRTHTLTQALASADQVLKNYDNHSIDLIYARPGQTPESWQRELESAFGLGFKHLSLYQLTIEEGTVFAAKKVKPLDEEIAATMYDETVNYLRRKGMPRYEVSNFAPPQYESAHNKCYWQGDDYIGIGRSAHGRLKINNRFYAIEHPHQFEELSATERAKELVIMGLRLQKGLCKKHFKQCCHLEFDSFADQNKINMLVDMGFLHNDSEVIRAGDEGFKVLDRLIAEICP